MADAAKDLINQSKPWKADVRWQVVAAEAAILAVLGIFMLINTERAGEWILQIIGLVFLIVSLQLAVVSFRNRNGEGAGLGVYDSFRSGIGVTVGVIATSIWWTDSIANSSARVILGWGLIAFAALQLIGIVVIRGKANFRPATLVLSGLTLVLGILLLTTDNASSEGRINFLAIVMVVFGVILGGLAYLLKSKADAAEAPAV
ncbi:MAG: DUF308 domain-containing protein [Thermomicrobiales bacterium]|nr:DUF308 domain-containing protein [Thermomicrobiales bacterium]